jgi:hypothetical protein
MRAVYQGVLAMMAQHQDRTRTVRLRGKWVPVDPRAWVNAFNVESSVAVGRGTIAERMQVFAATAGKQEQILSPTGRRTRWSRSRSTGRRWRTCWRGRDRQRRQIFSGSAGRLAAAAAAEAAQPGRAAGAG